MRTRKNPDFAKTTKTNILPTPIGQTTSKETETLKQANMLLQIQLEARNREVLELRAEIEKLTASIV
jgi:hypothetical protein